jgi:hypothetical protein
MRALPLLIAALLWGCEPAAAPALPPPGPGATPLTIVSTPPGAAVSVNGVIVGNAPVTVEVSPGPKKVRATLSGYYPAPAATVVVERGRPASHELHLVASH